MTGQVPARHLDHEVIKRRLEAGGGLARDCVDELGQRSACAEPWRVIGLESIMHEYVGAPPQTCAEGGGGCGVRW